MIFSSYSEDDSPMFGNAEKYKAECEECGETFYGIQDICSNCLIKKRHKILECKQSLNDFKSSKKRKKK